MADLSGVNLELVNTAQKAGEFMTWLGERRPDDILAVDTETGELPGNNTKDAFSPWHGRLRLVQVGDGETGWAIPWDGWNGVFHEAMAKFEGELICHNVAFEAKWFAKQSNFEIPWHRTHDTMIAAAVCNPLESVALKTLTGKYVDRRAAAMQSMLDQAMVKGGWTWGTIPIETREYWAYGALDTVLTVRLWDHYKDRVGPGKQFNLPYDLEMGARRICTIMELNGARVDTDYSQRKFDELSDYSQQIRDWIKTTYGISAGSNVALIDVFQNKLGETIDEVTPSGQKKMDKVQLKKFTVSGSHEAKQLAGSILKMRKASKLADTYLANLLSKNIDGIIHPNIRTMGARTGRMSITEPALQTLPKGDKVIRTAFIARDPENESLITSDLDQVEFRMTAALSKDVNLIELFARCDRDGGDAFTEIMREVYQDNSLQKSDDRRKLIKGTVYGKLYGAGVPKMALTAGVEESQMKAVVDAFDSQYPGVKMFSKMNEDIGMRNLRATGTAFIETATGRRLPCDDDRVYTLTNYAIQGGAAEVFKLDLLKLDAAGLTDYMVVPVHDEIVMSVPNELVDEVKPIVQECMTTRSWQVPLTAGIDGPFKNWGEGSG